MQGEVDGGEGGLEGGELGAREGAVGDDAVDKGLVDGAAEEGAIASRVGRVSRGQGWIKEGGRT